MIFLCLLLTSTSFIQLPLNMKHLFPSFSNPGLEARKVSGGLIILSDNPLDSHFERRPVLGLNLRYLFIG